MVCRPNESHRQWHHRIREAAAAFYSEVLPLSAFDEDNMTISIQLGDDPQILARFTIDVMDAATSGDAAARSGVNAELLRVEEKRLHSMEAGA